VHNGASIIRPRCQIFTGKYLDEKAHKMECINTDPRLLFEILDL